MLLLAITTLALDLVLVSFWPLVRAAAASPRILIGWPTLELLLTFVSPVTLVVFLVALYQELTGYTAPSRRQAWAFAAACGMAVRIGLRARQLQASAVALNALSPQIRAQLPASAFDLRGQWMSAILRNIIPAMLWIGLLLLFWRDLAPLGRKWTRRLAFVLCLFTTAQAVNGIAQILSRRHRSLPDWPRHPVVTLWNLIILPAVVVAASAALPCFLFAIWRTGPEHREGLTEDLSPAVE